MRKYENIFFLLLAAIGAAVFAGSMNISSLIVEPLTASAYGKMISGCFVVSCIARIIQNMVLTAKGAEDKKVTVAYPKIVFGMCIMVFVYAFGITSIGYFVSTFLFMWAMLVLLGDSRDKKQIIRMAVFSLVFCIVLYFLFQLMSVYLPKALLF